ncbi:hypothetical protein GQ53DRAFT_750544 [Thozetella sp. PMI_491]|nr:hypothetical protein GQ53DRAFT_750544 [Thozetella sp. PMI_491]
MSENGYTLERRHSAATVDDDVVDDGHSSASDGLHKPPPAKPGLSFAEKKSLAFLCALYFVHAIPLQFSWITMPILLRQQVSYSALGTFLISQYPYSWKVAWSPLVDGFHFTWLGRRKTWIVPSLLAGGAALLWLAFDQDSLVTEVAGGKSSAIIGVVLAWAMVMFVCSNIRIALDSWAVDVLSPPNVHWASPIASIGEAVSSFLSVNLFLGVAALTAEQDEAGKRKPTSSRFFFESAAFAFVITAALLLIGNRQDKGAPRGRTIRDAYATIYKILKLRHVWILMVIHMTSMIGFITNDTITVLQLVKNNFTDYELAGLATVAIPFALAGGLMVGQAFQTRHPLHVWRQLFPWRLLLAFVSQLTVLFISRYPNSFFRWLVVFLPFCLSRFFESAMWVSFVAFHAQVSDPQYGGIYMSLLSTTLNIRYDTLQFVFTKTIGMIDGSEDLTKPSPLIDGYQIVNAAAVVLAVPIYLLFLKPATLYLQSIDVSAWRIRHSDGASPMTYEMVGTRDDDEHEA